MTRRVVLVLVALAWIAGGVYGTVSYGSAYITYRGFPPPRDPRGVQPGHLVHERFYSRALHRWRKYDVYLPPGYAADAMAGERFPALYLLHGSPGGPGLFLNAARAGVALDAGVQSGRLRPFLIVMPNGSDGSFRSDTEWADTPHGRYESFVLDVVHSVDSRFRTLASRRFRAIGGNSEGAYAAVNIALRRPRTFGIAESWSGYFVQRPIGPFAHASLATVAANSPELYVPRLRAQLRRWPLHAYIYVGKREVIRPKNLRFVRELRRYGGHVTFGVFPGAHSWRLWRDQTPRMLRYASHWFGAGP